MEHDTPSIAPPPRPTVDETLLRRLEKQAANGARQLLAGDNPAEIRRLAVAGAGGTY